MSRKSRGKSKVKPQGVLLKEHLEEHQQKVVSKEKAERESRTKAKRKYNKEHYILLQVYLEKELVSQFKDICKELGESQAGVIREFLNDFISENS